MVTQVVKTIGTGGDYPSWTEAKAAMPTNFVTADQQWTLKFKDQKHTVPITMNSWAAGATDATRYVELTTDTGASIFDKANFGTSPYRYDPTRGAAIETSAGTTSAIECGLAYTRISKLQLCVKDTGTNALPTLNSNADFITADRLIIEGTGMNSVLPAAYRCAFPNSILSNSLVVQRRANASTFIAQLQSGAQLVNCTLVSTGIKLTYGVMTKYAAPKMTNVAVMNVTTPDDGVAGITKTKCYSDATATGYTTVPFSTATFTDIADATYDFRTVTGSGLVDAGVTIAAGATSANGLNRGSYGAAYDVGAWEFDSSNAAPDTTAPVLSAPTATATGATSASGSVATDEAGGTLFFMASTNATESAATIKTGNSASVTATGTQNILFSGLAPNTTYYGHYVQVDAAGNTSNVANTASSFTTPAVDSTAPTFAGGAAITAGTITTSSVAFSYPAATDNVAVTGYETSKDGGATWQDNGSGLTGQFTGLAAGTTYQIAVRARDAQNNKSSTLTLSMTTTAAPTTGTFKTRVLGNNSTSLWATGTAVAWEWHQARIGTQGTVTYGSGTIASDGTLTATGLPLSTGFLLVAVPGANLLADRPYYQAGTVA